MNFMEHFDTRPSWDTLYMSLCYLMAYRSPDQSTKVGSVITTKDNVHLVSGYNGWCRGIGEEKRFHKRPEKYLWFEHAERNAIYNAANTGIRMDLAWNIYIPWLPCADCARAIIQTGIKRVVVHKQGHEAYESMDDSWAKSNSISTEMFEKVGIELDYYDGPIIGGLQGMFRGKLFDFNSYNYGG